MRDHTKNGETKQKIIDLIKRDKKITQTELCIELNKARGSISGHITELVKQGRLRPVYNEWFKKNKTYEVVG